MNTTHKIISMERAETSSKKPMWRCQCENGDKVNAFQNTDLNKDSSRFFSDAGYLVEMLELAVGELITWRQHPIDVELQKTADGKWWELVAVAPRPDGACPDPQFKPDFAFYRQKAIDWARLMCRESLPKVAYWDTETTGTSFDDEIISIAAVAQFGDIPLLKELIRPENMDRLVHAEHVHGLTAEALQDAPTFPELDEQIGGALDEAIWIIYNAPFDTQMLDQVLIRHSTAPITPLAVHDAMEYFAMFHGEWDPIHRKFVPKKLTEAAEYFGLEFDHAHDALADALMTREVVRAMARDEE